MVVLRVVALVGFGNVKQLFFPESSMNKFMVDYWAPEGTRIQTVSKDLRNHLAGIDMVDSRQPVVFSLTNFTCDCGGSIVYVHKPDRSRPVFAAR